MIKLKKLAVTLLSVAICGVLLIGCSTSKNVELTFTIDDTDFTLNSTVQDLYDAGFVLCDTGAGNIISDSELPEFEGRSVDTISFYYVGRPIDEKKAEYTGIRIQVYNNSSTACNIKDCSIFDYTYELDSDLNRKNGKVLINDTDFFGLTPEQGVTAMEGFGITFEEDEKAEFIDEDTNSGYGWSVSTSSGSYIYSLTSNKVIEYAEDGSSTEDLLIGEVNFKKKLNIDYN